MTRFFTGVLSGLLLLAVLPSSSHYDLHNYGFGSGATSNSTSSSYKLNATTGEVANTPTTSATFKAGAGNNNAQQSYVPPAPTFTNPSSYYNQLHFAVNIGSNPTDATYAIAISSDNFVTTSYVKSDDTLTTTFSASLFQTYAAWGSGTGQQVVGLSPSTTYKMKVSSMQGNFTQSAFGPTASASTVAPSISFTIFTDSQASPPFVTSFPKLLPATVENSNDKIWFNLATNAVSGAEVYIKSANAGLTSASVSNTIASATANLANAGVSTGYGAVDQSASATSGTVSMISPFNSGAQSVGGLTTILQEIFGSTGPVTGGTGSLLLMAKASSTTKAAGDYQDTLTLTSAAAF